MDQQSFDRLARLLGEATDRRAGLKAALGALLGAGGAAVALDADAKKKDRGRGAGPEAGRKKRRTCKPACGSGYECVKRQCVCATEVVCGDACCRIGQVCDGGACVPEPEPAQCIAAGEPCKGRGRRCCDGRVCASGQDGDRDVACYVPKTGRCERTSDCVYGMSCQDGRCEPPAPGSLAAPCDATSQQLCTTPGAVCTAYDGAGAPGGNYCTLPLDSACSGDKECTCYKCWYVNPGTTGTTRAGRAAARFACCGPQGYACTSDRNCCLGTNCVNGVCQGSICVPDDAPGCTTDADCCSDNALCRNRTCQLGIPNGEECSTASDSLPCIDAAATCTTYSSGSPAGNHCLLPDSATCSPNGVNAACRSGYCHNGSCQQRVATGSACTAPNGIPCADANATCTTYTDGNPSGTFCLLANGQGCSPNGASTGCRSEWCANSVCVAKIALKATCTQGGIPCATVGATCGPYADNDPAGDYCLLSSGSSCTPTGANDSCRSDYCHTDNTCKNKISNGSSCTVGGVPCKDANATCTTYADNDPAGNYCLLGTTKTCAVDNDCVSQKCANTVCVECLSDAACESLNSASPAGTCERWACSSGACAKVAAIDAICTKPGGGTGYCDSQKACVAAPASCTVTAGMTGADLKTAVEGAAYGAVVTLAAGVTYTPATEISVSKFACADNVYADNSSSCTAKVPWKLTIRSCDETGTNPAISGDATVNTTDANPANWTYTGGHRILTVTDLALTIRRVDLKNGATGNDAYNINKIGSAVRALRTLSSTSPTLLDMQDLAVTGCEAYQGGGIFTEIKSVVLKNVDFTGNRATKNGGAAFTKSYAGQSVTLDNVTMTGNSANGGLATGNCQAYQQYVKCQGSGIYVDTVTNDLASLICSNQTANDISNIPPALTGVNDCGSGVATTFFDNCGCATTSQT